jgi:hypothetical protein
LAGGYAGIPAGFGTPLPYDNPIEAELALVVDSPTSSDPYDACESITNAAALDGKIAVIRRGTCEFGFKILAAQTNGAIGVIMVNNVASPSIITMGEGADDASGTPPSVMISQADGELLISALESGEVITASLLRDTYNIDGDFDNGIIAHEYGHGISTRLVGGRDQSLCLLSLVVEEQMGEGWSDWFALVMTQELDDTAVQPRGIGTYVLGQDQLGSGIRPARYSTDFAVNDYTYGDLPNDEITVPHGVGFVWSTILWDMYWAFIDEYGFDADIYNGTGGNNMAMQLVIDGLKLLPCAQPGFVTGRDAILEADDLLYDGSNTKNCRPNKTNTVRYCNFIVWKVSICIVIYSKICRVTCRPNSRT